MKKNAPFSRTLRVLARLLAYPDASLRADLPDMREVIAIEHALPTARRAELEALMAHIERAGPLQAESDYVELFDRGRATSLHLFEHVHGDSRDRGPAMIDLARTYEQGGLVLADGELPDYLPVVLEFASTRPPAEARAFLGETAHILNAIFAALVARDSLYAAVINAAMELAGEKVVPVKLPEEPALDESWAEPEVFGGCSSAGQSRPDQAQPVQFVRKADLQPSGAVQ